MISADVFDGKEKEVNTTIAMHLIRQGQFELADTFIRVDSPLEPLIDYRRSPVLRYLRHYSVNFEKCTISYKLSEHEILGLLLRKFTLAYPAHV